ncbi:MAG TPA: FkbM family methyltransferase [Pirellulales bacterium]|nr:FkbM family methyltransferase [Pirellulales bacterium]
MKLHLVKFLRRPTLALFSRLNPGDITIRHHWTGDRLRLHSYRHKGYWYHGRNREQWIMETLGRVVHPGDTVVEVGGHIGYVALWLARLVGPGHVYVFEPGPNNLRYIERNLHGKPNVTLVPKGVGDVSTQRTMFVERLTGLNNTFVEESPLLKANAAFDGFNADELRESVPVELVRFDDFAAEHSLRADLIKIDVEGFESEVLQGMREVLRTQRPKLMVEVTRHPEEVWSILQSAGYIAFGEDLKVLTSAQELHGNVFCMCPDIHGQYLRELGINVVPVTEK